MSRYVEAREEIKAAAKAGAGAWCEVDGVMVSGATSWRYADIELALVVIDPFGMYWPLFYSNIDFSERHATLESAKERVERAAYDAVLIPYLNSLPSSC